jgi:hypothetical protein
MVVITDDRDAAERQRLERHGRKAFDVLGQARALGISGSHQQGTDHLSARLRGPVCNRYAADAMRHENDFARKCRYRLIELVHPFVALGVQPVFLLHPLVFRVFVLP